jgi:hypothetical protein
VELEGTGHEIPLTRPESVYGALRQISGAASDVAAAPLELFCRKGNWGYFIGEESGPV